MARRARLSSVAPMDRDDLRHRRDRNDPGGGDAALRLLARFDRAGRMGGRAALDPDGDWDVRGVRDLLRRMAVGDVAVLARWVDKYGCDSYGRPWYIPRVAKGSRREVEQA